jgi:hypothetical protein
MQPSAQEVCMLTQMTMVCSVQRIVVGGDRIGMNSGELLREEIRRFALVAWRPWRGVAGAAWRPWRGDGAVGMAWRARRGGGRCRRGRGEERRRGGAPRCSGRRRQRGSGRRRQRGSGTTVTAGRLCKCVRVCRWPPVEENGLKAFGTGCC